MQLPKYLIESDEIYQGLVPSVWPDHKQTVSTIPGYRVLEPSGINDSDASDSTKEKILWIQQAKQLYAKTEVPVRRLVTFVGITMAAKQAI